MGNSDSKLKFRKAVVQLTSKNQVFFDIFNPKYHELDHKFALIVDLVHLINKKPLSTAFYYQHKFRY